MIAGVIAAMRVSKLATAAMWKKLMRCEVIKAKGRDCRDQHRSGERVAEHLVQRGPFWLRENSEANQQGRHCGQGIDVS